LRPVQAKRVCDPISTEGKAGHADVPLSSQRQQGSIKQEDWGPVLLGQKAKS
jgi:hypothetical protein